MKLATIIVASTLLTGCATGCYKSCILGFGPGNPVFNKMADNADATDLCQTQTHSTLTGVRLKPDGHVPPEFCKARGRNRITYDIYDRSGRRVGSVRSN